MSALDCVVIGHHETDFAAFAQSQEAFKEHSASHSEVVTNSIRGDSVRLTYMDLLNKILQRTSGRPWALSAFDLPSLAVAYLVSYLRRSGFTAEGINMFTSGQEELRALLVGGVKTVAITTTYYVDDQPIKDIVRFVRQHSPDAVIIVGGPRILAITNGSNATTQRLLLKRIGADVYVRSSQGELTLGRVVGALRDGKLDLTGIPNLILPDGRDFVSTAVEVESNDLDANAVDWTTFERKQFLPTTYMRTARSCPFACAFCNYPVLAGAHTLASIETVEREMRYLADSGLEHLIIVDDTFNVPLPRFKALLRMMIRNRFTFRWVSFFRCSNADDEAFDLMKESGCLGVYLGIESGDQRILELMNKFAKVDRYADAIRKLHDRGIMTLVSLILGFPGETAESVDTTIRFLNENAPTFYNVQVYYHDTQAPIERRREELGIEGSGYSWSHNTMDWREAIVLKEHMLKSVEASVQLPLYGFSIWTVPCLMQHGINLDQIIKFGKFANQLSRAELVGEPRDLDRAVAEFCAQGHFDNLR